MPKHKTKPETSKTESLKKKSKMTSKQSETTSQSGGATVGEIEEKYTFFYTTKSPFSQHHPSNFTVDGVNYVHAEQYMMHQKAVLFGDGPTADQILLETDPKAIKKLGRQVKDFDEQIWKENRSKIVKKGSYAKFSQNPDLKEQLLSTEGSILVEASPRDTIWGIGMGANNPKAKTKKTWRGSNLLGYILTEVRDQLIQESSTKEETK
ncbi:N-glycosidase Npun_R5314-like [Patiria miniata]|uniref:NADAR domain-containing protein n=1 Tax=Patiria miniata TaxID=46514 RepID=A0A913ZCG9_PATMI|nr:N-glycosidase Npun_R5314-like [Patiria miniata]